MTSRSESGEGGSDSAELFVHVSERGFREVWLGDVSLVDLFCVCPPSTILRWCVDSHSLDMRVWREGRRASWTSWDSRREGGADEA